jgi:hypothetical protein
MSEQDRFRPQGTDYGQPIADAGRRDALASLAETVAAIRQRAGEVDEAELDALIEEARAYTYAQQVAGATDD